jgi:uncharacterized membrane protein YbhN (UPF0104 family)
LTRPRVGKLLSWTLAVAALAFVAWVVPIRDRCWDPQAPASTHVAVSRDETGCTLHLQEGAMHIGRTECAQLRCEPGVASALGHARVGILVALLALYAGGMVAWAARWRALLGLAEIELPLWHVLRLSIEAQAGGILLPGGIGGDALRVASVLSMPTRGGAKPKAVIVIASVLLDRAVGLSVVAALAASLGFAFGGVDAGPLAVALAAVPVGFLVGLTVLRVAPVHRVGWLVRGRLGGVVEPVLAYVRDPRALRAIGVAALLSVLVAGIQLATVRGLVLALGDTPGPAGEKWIYVGTAMAFIVAAIPALPGGWGTADAAYVFFFGLAGLPAAAALAVCLLYRLFWYLSGVAGAILHLARPRAAPP